MTDQIHPPGPRDPLHPDITQALLNKLVHQFYESIREDKELAPLFNDTIQDNWPEHLDRMTQFWGAIALKTGAYKGKPVPKHVALSNLSPEHFKIWLRLFRTTAFDVCGPQIAPLLIDKAEHVAQSLQLAYFFKDRMAPLNAFKNGEIQTNSL